MATMQTGTDFVGNFVHTAAEQTDRTGKAKFLAAAVGTFLCNFKAEPDEKIFGQILSIF